MLCYSSVLVIQLTLTKRTGHVISQNNLIVNPTYDDQGRLQDPQGQQASNLFGLSGIKELKNLNVKFRAKHLSLLLFRDSSGV